MSWPLVTDNRAFWRCLCYALKCACFSSIYLPKFSVNYWYSYSTDPRLFIPIYFSINSLSKTFWSWFLSISCDFQWKVIHVLQKNPKTTPTYPNFFSSKPDWKHTINLIRPYKCSYECCIYLHIECLVWWFRTTWSRNGHRMWAVCSYERWTDASRWC